MLSVLINGNSVLSVAQANSLEGIRVASLSLTPHTPEDLLVPSKYISGLSTEVASPLQTTQDGTTLTEATLFLLGYNSRLPIIFLLLHFPCL